jgi:hypothetical protein|tara:strand:+ start:332 stop:622 length:291 start_codon:yes stop_codon:yes gene_type:complete
MKITISKLKQIIKEELAQALDEQGSFIHSDDMAGGGGTDWALTTGQAMAAMRAGLRQDTDLKGILFNATQGHHPESIELLNHPEFQKDPRVKKHGY